MSYTAWNLMREHNLSAHGIDAPQQPPDYRDKRSTGKLERACLDFIRDPCEELRFDDAHRAANDLEGRGVRPGQIPLYMQRDTDRLCLENALHRFLQSGTAQDAFGVYFRYLEMFVGNYARSSKMIELLAEFESNASALLMKHRDHYSHSAYVFTLGMAVYRSSPAFRAAYKKSYGLSEERSAAHHFLRYWGLASLFHDIGYPFELPFEQIKSYFNGAESPVPFISYQGVLGYVALDEGQRAVFAGPLGRPPSTGTINEVLSVRTAQLLGEAYEKSAERITLEDLDVITAILLHNSMFKFSLRVGAHKNQPLEMDRHPLAYMLMLCDELHCWDRAAYGQNSRRELHPMWCDFEFDGDEIRAGYQFDKQLEWKKAEAKGTYSKMWGEEPKFVTDIEEIVALNRPGALKLKIHTSFEKNQRVSRTYLSDSSFLHLYNFAVALNGRYKYGTLNYPSLADGNTHKDLEKDFEELFLEYKLSNILQAKAFAKYLDAIGCFYTDRPVAYEKLEKFSEANMDLIGPMEHDRWLAEKRSMGWQYGTAYQSGPEPKMGSLQSMESYIVECRKESTRQEVVVTTEEYSCLREFIADMHKDFGTYSDADATKIVNELTNKHNVAINMLDLIFQSKMPSIQPFDGPEDCARLLCRNFVGDKNTAIQLEVLESLKAETQQKLLRAGYDLNEVSGTGSEAVEGELPSVTLGEIRRRFLTEEFCLRVQDLRKNKLPYGGKGAPLTTAWPRSWGGATMSSSPAS